jgi:hypothetical protein
LPEELNDPRLEILNGSLLEPTHGRPDEAVVGGEQLSRAGVADALKRAIGKSGIRQLEGAWISVRIARDLAEDVIASSRVGQHNGWTELRLRQIGEWEWNENYRSC